MIELDYIEGIDIIDIFDLLKTISINKSILAENVNNILMLADGSKLSIKLNELWEEYCDKEQICPCCGDELEVIEERFKDDEEPQRIRVCKNPKCGS